MTTVVEADISTHVEEIPIVQFLLMDAGYNKHPTSPKIHLDQTTKTGEYVTNVRFKDMLARELAYRESHDGLRPTAVWIVKPAASNTVPTPPLIQLLEKTLGGSIRNLSDLYKLVQEKGKYLHYDCVSYTNPSVSVPRIVGNGLNCADYVYVMVDAIEAFIAWGIPYKFTIAHVYCNNSKGQPDSKAGHFLLIKVSGGEFSKPETVDFAEAASGKKNIGANMCFYGFNDIVGDKLCFN